MILRDLNENEKDNNHKYQDELTNMLAETNPTLDF